MHKCIMVKIGENKKRKLIENRGKFITFAEIVGNLLYAPLTYADGRLCSIFSTFPSTSYSPHPSIPIPPHAPYSLFLLLLTPASVTHLWLKDFEEDNAAIASINTSNNRYRLC